MGVAVPLKGIPVNVGICITAREIFGRLTGFRECTDILSRFRFQNVAFRLAFVRQSIDSFFGNEPLESIQHLKLYRRALGLVLSSARADDTLRQAAALYKKEPVHAFSDQAVAATLELAARYCPRDGGQDISTPDDHDDLGRVLFSFHDSMFSPRFVPKAAAVSDWEKVSDEMMFEVVRNHIASNYLGNLGNGVARISAFISADTINSHFEQRAGEPLTEWWKKRLGVDLQGYLRAVMLIGAASSQCSGQTMHLARLAVRQAKLLGSAPEADVGAVESLLALAKRSAAEMPGGEFPKNLTEFMYQAHGFRIRPILDFGDYLLPTSAHAISEKFLIGLPHVLDEMARQSDSHADISKVRGKFGYVLESYLGHLLKEWLHGHADTQVLLGFEPADKSTDWDVIIVRGDVAYVFEVKAKVLLLGIRQEGSFQFLDSLLYEALVKTRVQAERLLALVRSPDAPAELKNVKRIVPILVIFDRVPLRFPYQDRYEKHVETKSGRPLFSAPGAEIAPVQTFEIEGIEAWELHLDLRPGSDAVFSFLEKRPHDPLTRHDRKFPPVAPNAPWRTPDGPVQRSLYEARTMLEAMKGEIKFDPEPEA